MLSKPRFLLIDGHALIYRAYYAFPDLTDPEGSLVNAVYGFSRILLNSLRDFSPRYIAVAFDHKAPTLRAKQYEAYKAHRPEMPDDLKPQIELIQEVVVTLNVPQFSVAGYEADDLIGTIVDKLQRASALSKESLLITVVTGDKDLLQLVTDSVRVYIPARGRNQSSVEYEPEEVEAHLGVTPDQVVDLKALMGDSSDNVPGVKGVGPKTARQLILAFGSLDKLYEALESKQDLLPAGQKSLLTESLVKKLERDREQAYLSRELVELDRQVDIDFKLDDCRVTDYDKAAAVALFKRLGFNSLTRLLPKDDFEKGVQAALF